MTPLRLGGFPQVAAAAPFNIIAPLIYVLTCYGLVGLRAGVLSMAHSSFLYVLLSMIATQVRTHARTLGSHLWTADQTRGLSHCCFFATITVGG